MGNRLVNAGFVEGLTGWTLSAGATGVIDDQVVGGPGRNVLTIDRVLAAGGEFTATSRTMAVTAGQSVEAAIHVNGENLSARQVNLEIVDAGGGLLATAPLQRRRAAAASASRGLRPTFDDWFLLAPAGAPGSARLVVRGAAASAGAAKLHLLKPFLAPGGSSVSRWDPGTHFNLDLQSPVWPTTLSYFRDTPTIEPFAQGEFQGDAGIALGEPLYGGKQWSFQGAMRLDAVQGDALEAFYDQTRKVPFFFLRQDTDQLCFARWLAAGAPRPVELRGASAIYQVGLRLWVA